MITTFIVIPDNSVKEKSSFTATAYFRLLDASTTPTTARYRVDDVTTGKKIRDWTDLTPATSIEIALTPDDNAMSTGTTRIERRRITVETNTDLDTQVREMAYWSVENIEEF